MSRPRRTSKRASARGAGTAPARGSRTSTRDGGGLEAPRHGSRPEQVYARLRDLIVQGSLAPGSRIVETEIATRLGVSRTPVREALQRLQQEGYVLDTPGAQQSRLTVAPLTRDDVQELLDIVGALESLAARNAASAHVTDRARLVRALRGANADFEHAGAGGARSDHGDLYDADERFHRAIIEAGAGPRLLALHDAVKPQAERYIRMYISMLTGDLGDSVAEHEAIIRAIEEGKAPGAALAVWTNWIHAAERLARVIALAGERGAW